MFVWAHSWLVCSVWSYLTCKSHLDGVMLIGRRLRHEQSPGWCQFAWLDALNSISNLTCCVCVCVTAARPALCLSARYERARGRRRPLLRHTIARQVCGTWNVEC